MSNIRIFSQPYVYKIAINLAAVRCDIRWRLWGVMGTSYFGTSKTRIKKFAYIFLNHFTPIKSPGDKMLLNVRDYEKILLTRESNKRIRIKKT